MSKAKCSATGCDRDAWQTGLCAAHYQQKRRHPKAPLKPLRESPAMVMVSFRVSVDTKAAIDADREGAREALDRWAKRQG